MHRGAERRAVDRVEAHAVVEEIDADHLGHLAVSAFEEDRLAAAFRGLKGYGVERQTGEEDVDLVKRLAGPGEEFVKQAPPGGDDVDALAGGPDGDGSGGGPEEKVGIVAGPD